MIGWVAAHPEERPALQHPQQLHLGGQRDLADLVQEDGAAVGQLEPAQPPLGRAGEGALLVAEQLRLEQGLRQRGAVHRDEGLVPPRGEVVQPLGHQLLAAAALALDQHGAGDRRHLLDLDQHLLDRRALPDDAGALLQMPAIHQATRGGHHVVRRHRLGHDLGGAESPHPLGPLRVGGLQQGEGGDLGVVRQGRELLHVRLVHRAGEDHQLRVLPADRAPGVVQRGEHRGGELGRLEGAVEPHGGLEVVHRDENLGGHAWKVMPNRQDVA